MKYIGYIVGVVIVVVTAVIMLNNRPVIGTNDALAQSGTSDIIVKCNGANIFLAPQSITVTFAYETNVGGDDFTIGTPTVDVVGNIGGGSTALLSSSGTPGAVEAVYAILQSPEMLHVYSCQNSGNTQTDLNWKATSSVTANMNVGAGTSAAADPSTDFTQISTSDAAVVSNKAFTGSSPIFTFAVNDFRILVEGSLSASQDPSDVTTYKQNVTYTSVPKP